MQPSFKWKYVASLGLVGITALLFVLAYMREQEPLPTQPLSGQGTEAIVALKPNPQDIVAFWSDQVKKAEQAGQPDIVTSYRERMAAYALGVPASLPVAASGTPAITPSTSIELYARSTRLTQTSSSSSSSSSSPTPTVSASTNKSLAPLAKHEPASGVYIGMLGADRRVGYDVNKIEGVYGRKHALYLAYVGWRKVQTDTNTYFPARTAERVKELDGALQIGWEPRYGLDDVQDDEYVRRFAREAKASGIPIFLRYGSEMNGAWVKWHGEPQKYIEKFRLIHDIMAEEAPNVAMVWSPNFWPPDNLDEYYPGDAYVDWVGFSLYASPFQNGQEYFKGTMVDTFAPIYARYNHKPIMISEGAIAHTFLPTNKPYWTWAEGQLNYMYGVLPRLFPQVKAITYFNFSRAQAQRTNGEYVYDLGENPFMDATYQRLIASNWFVSKVETGGNPAPYQYTPVTTRSLPTGRQSVLVYPKVENEQGEWPFAVALYQGKQRLGVSYEAPWEIDIQVDAASAAEPWYVVTYNVKLEPIAIASGTVKP